jgi:hypothetical protein
MSEEGSNWYHEAGEVQYHANVFSADPFVRATIARNRALKLQPLIGAQDRLLEYGVGIGLNLRDLRCRERVGYDLSGYGREACEAEGIAFTDDLESLSGRQFDTVLCRPAAGSFWWCPSNGAGVSGVMPRGISTDTCIPGIPWPSATCWTRRAWR